MKYMTIVIKRHRADAYTKLCTDVTLEGGQQ